MTTLQQDINRFNKKYIPNKQRYKAVKWDKDTVINPHINVIDKEEKPKVIGKSGTEQKKSI